MNNSKERQIFQTESPYPSHNEPVTLTGKPLGSAVTERPHRTKPFLTRLIVTILALLALLSAAILAVDRTRNFIENEMTGALLRTVFGAGAMMDQESPAAMHSPTAAPLSPFMALSSYYLEDFSYSPEQNQAPPVDDAPSLTLEELFNYDYTQVPDGKLPLIPMDLSSTAAGGLGLANMSGYTPDLTAYTARENPIPDLESLYQTYGADAPIVLILHTHATEAYSADGQTCYTEGESPRSTDPTQNVVAVGSVLADTLNAAGINTLHCTELHDAESYRYSYTRAAQSIESYLEKYPSIQYVFDVHRDSISTANRCKTRLVTVDQGKAVAQFMCVVGTDSNGGNHPSWEDNLTVAVKLQSASYQYNNKLARNINLRGSSYNEEYTKGSLLLEIGTCGNSLEEAKRTAEILGTLLAGIIKDDT